MPLPAAPPGNAPRAPPGRRRRGTCDAGEHRSYHAKLEDLAVVEVRGEIGVEGGRELALHIGEHHLGPEPQHRALALRENIARFVHDGVELGIGDAGAARRLDVPLVAEGAAVGHREPVAQQLLDPDLDAATVEDALVEALEVPLEHVRRVGADLVERRVAALALLQRATLLVCRAQPAIHGVRRDPLQQGIGHALLLRSIDVCSHRP